MEEKNLKMWFFPLMTLAGGALRETTKRKYKIQYCKRMKS